MKPKNRILYLIVFVTLFSLFVVMPSIPIKLNLGFVSIDTRFGGDVINANILGVGRVYQEFEVKKGLDIQGGISVTLRAIMDDISPVDRDDALEAVRNVIERRVNLFGVSEPNIVTSKVGVGDEVDYRVLVELPGVFETAEAISLIGETARLEFREEAEIDAEIDEESAIYTPFSDRPFIPTGLTGRDLRRADVVFGEVAGTLRREPQVSIVFNEEGARKFAELTQRNLGKPVAIFLDDTLVSAPTVQTPIMDGNAVITGGFAVEEAQTLAIQLRAGALPVPIEVIEQREIGATLGEEAVRATFAAGVVGLILVGIFMLGYYGKLGLIANTALIIYTIIIFAIYKGAMPGLGPIVLTLPGLAGFVLSIGMAVDANILISERILEEKKLKKPLGVAIEEGFARSWNSIRDSNIATLITTLILINPFDWSFFVTSGPVRGFAITLAVGVLLSMFTGITVTRNLIRLTYKG